MEENKATTRPSISKWVSQLEPAFSYYCSPILNIKPDKDINLFEAYSLIKGSTYKAMTAQLRSLADTEGINEFKKIHLDFCTFSGKFSGRKAANLIEHSGYLTLDFDHVNNVSELKSKLIEDPYLDPELIFTSPSGDGLKCIIKIDLGTNTHQEYFDAISNYILATYDLEVDKSGKDVSRACFLCHDPDAYIKPDYLGIENNKDTKPFDPNNWRMNPSPFRGENPESKVQTNETLNQVEEVIQQIEATGIDLTSTYSDWVKIGFALTDQFGEQGREYFHRISRFYPNYNRKDCDQQFANCLRSSGSGVTIRSFFQLCKTNGITYTNNKEVAPKKMDSQDLLFPISLYPQLPEILKQITSVAVSDSEKDMLLLGSLGVISACLPNIYGIYGGHKVHPNLYVFISAGASAGKGKLNYCKQLVNPIHMELRKEAKLLSGRYEMELAQYNAKKSKDPLTEKPSKPAEKMLFIPANSSSTGAYQLLAENDGIGLIFETEGDTLALAFKSDYGNYSDGFRKGFHHEAISYFRRADKEYVDIAYPRLSAVLSGTPNQIHALIPSAENGLLSRFIFYSIEIVDTWNNVFEKSSSKGLREHFEILGNDFYELYSHLKGSNEIQIYLTDSQEVEFNKFFEELQTEYMVLHGEEFVATIRRLALITFRICMILSALRISESGDFGPEQSCDNLDFESALSMASVLLKHSEKVFTELPMVGKRVPRKNKKDKFLESLPKEFNRKSYLELASKQSIPVKTADGYIKNFCDSEILNKDKHDHYMKN